MKDIKFKINVYDWDIRFIEIESKNDFRKAKQIMDKFGIEKRIVKSNLENIKKNRKNGGTHSYDNYSRKSLIFILRSSSKRDRRNVLAHEKRHCEDNILEWFNIKDIEASAMLAGYLSEKLKL